MIYQQSDFSPIHPPEEKPEVVGWYPCAIRLDSVKKMRANPENIKSTFTLPFEFWNGKEWEAFCNSQQMYWFGLNHDPARKD